MGMCAGVTIIFLNSEGKVVSKKYVDCYKGCHGCDEFSMPDGATTFVVSFSTSYSGTCDYCRKYESDYSDSDDE